jgi:cell division protease FtsH
MHEGRDYSDATADEIDREIKKLVNEAEARAKKTLQDNRATMDKLVAVLIEKETIEQEEIEKIMGVPQTKNTNGPGIEIVG